MKRAAGLVAGLIAVATLAGPAQADRERSPSSAEPSPAPHAVVVSLPLFALSSNAVAVQADRPLTRRASALLALGVRDGADGDYQAFAGSVGGELRFWLSRRQRGLYAGPRVEVELVHVASLGTATMLTEGVVGGYRVVIADRVELTANLGAIVRHDISSGGVPDRATFTVTYGVALGWVFP